MLTQSSRLSQERGALDIAHNRAKMHTTGQKHTTGRSAHNRAYANKRYLHKPNKPFCSYSCLIRWYVKHYGDSGTQQTVHLNQIWAVVQIFAFKTNACTSARGGQVPQNGGTQPGISARLCAALCSVLCTLARLCGGSPVLLKTKKRKKKKRVQLDKLCYWLESLE